MQTDSRQDDIVRKVLKFVMLVPQTMTFFFWLGSHDCAGRLSLKIDVQDQESARQRQTFVLWCVL